MKEREWNEGKRENEVGGDLRRRGMKASGECGSLKEV
jgi:hypothetical protein